MSMQFGTGSGAASSGQRSGAGSAGQQIRRGQPSSSSRSAYRSQERRGGSSKTHSRRLLNCLDRLRKQGLLVNFYEKLISEETSNMVYDSVLPEDEYPQDGLLHFLSGTMEQKGQRVTLHTQMKIRYQEYLLVRDMMNKKLPTLSFLPKEVEIKDWNAVVKALPKASSRLTNAHTSSHHSMQQQKMMPEDQVAPPTKVFQSVPVVYLYDRSIFKRDNKDLSSADPNKMKEALFYMLHNTHLGSRIFGQIASMSQKNKIQRGEILIESHRSLLLNMSQNFFSTVVQDESHAYYEHSKFLETFKVFLEFHLNGGICDEKTREEAFQSDEQDQVRIENYAVLQVIKTLFEGQTRKLPAFNYLRKLFDNQLTNVSIYEIEYELAEVERKKEEARKKDPSARGTVAIGTANRGFDKISAEYSAHQTMVLSDSRPIEKRVKQQMASVMGVQHSAAPTSNKSTRLDGAKEDLSFEGLLKGGTNQFGFGSGDPTRATNMLSNMPSNKRLNAISKRLEPTPTETLPSYSTLREVYEISNAIARYNSGSIPQQSVEVPSEDEKALAFQLQFCNSNQFLQEQEESRIWKQNKNNAAMNGESAEPPQSGENEDGATTEKKTENRRVRVTDDELRAYNPQESDVSSELFQMGHDLNVEEENKAKEESTDKDMTFYCLSLCDSILTGLRESFDRVPFTIRAMLKMLVLRARSRKNHIGTLDCSKHGKQRILLKDDEVYMLAELLVGCWLNTGFRNPQCFGLNPSLPTELHTQDLLFQSTRQIFEHLMMMQTLPEVEIKGFDISRINAYIKEKAVSVLWYFTQIVNVDYSEIKIRTIEQINDQQTKEETANVEAILIQIEDLKTILQLWKDDYQVYRGKTDKEKEDRTKYEKRFMSQMFFIMSTPDTQGKPNGPTLQQIICQPKFRMVDNDRYEDQKQNDTKEIRDSVYGWHPDQAPPSKDLRAYRELDPQLVTLGTMEDPRLEYREDQYLLIVNKLEKTRDWDAQLTVKYKKVLKEFCQRELVDTSNVTIEEEPEGDYSEDEDEEEKDNTEFGMVFDASDPQAKEHHAQSKRDAVYSKKQPQAVEASQRKATSPPPSSAGSGSASGAKKPHVIDVSGQQIQSPMASANLTRRRLKKNLKLDDVFQAVYTMYYNMMVLITMKQLIIDRVRDVTQPYTVGLAWNLTLILDSLRKDDMVQPKRTTKLQLICSSLKKQMIRIGIQDDALQQERLLRQFITVMQIKLKDHQLKIDDLKLQNEGIGGDCNYFQLQCAELLQYLKRIEFNDRLSTCHISKIKPEIYLVESPNDNKYYLKSQKSLGSTSTSSSTNTSTSSHGAGDFFGNAGFNSKLGDGMSSLALGHSQTLIDATHLSIAQDQMAQRTLHTILDNRYKDYNKMVNEVLEKKDCKTEMIKDIPMFIRMCCKRFKKSFRKIVQAENVQTIAYASAFEGAGAENISDTESSFSGMSEVWLNQSMSGSDTNSLYNSSSNMIDGQTTDMEKVDPLRLVQMYKFFVEHSVLQLDPEKLGEMLGIAHMPHLMKPFQQALILSQNQSLERSLKKNQDLRRLRDFVDDFIMRRIHQVIFDMGQGREYAGEQTWLCGFKFNAMGTTNKTKQKKKNIKLSAKDERIHKHLAGLKKFDLRHLSREEQKVDLYEEALQLFLQLPEEETPQTKLKLIQKSLRHANIARAFTRNNVQPHNFSANTPQEVVAFNAGGHNRVDRMTAPRQTSSANPSASFNHQHSSDRLTNPMASLLEGQAGHNTTQSLSSEMDLNAVDNSIVNDDKLVEFYKFFLSHVCQRSEPKYLKLFSQLSFTVLFDLQTPYWDKTQSDAKDLLGLLEIIDMDITAHLDFKH